MAEVILNLPLGISRVQSSYQDLFTRIAETPESWWVIKREEFPLRRPTVFRQSLRSWMRHRQIPVETKIDGQGNVYVRVGHRQGAEE